MKRIYQHIKEYLPFIFLAAIAIAIASFTIGKEIYGHREENLLSFAIVNFSGYLFPRPSFYWLPACWNWTWKKRCFIACSACF